jgi:hypothetical protein
VHTLATWRRFAQLGGPDRATVVRAALGLVATWAGLRICGFRRWKAFLDRRLPPAGTSVRHDLAVVPQALQLARLHSAAARHLALRTNCLDRAMSLYFLLRRRGLPAELRFGARKDAARLEAHAWVACLGAPLNEDQGEHRHFLPFDGVSPLMETLPD